MRRSTLDWLLILALVALASWFARETQHRRIESIEHSRWVTTDPDTLYQARRLERALDEGLPVAEFDERLNAPHGSAIPWPPYYTTTLWALLAPFAPDDAAARSAWVECGVASMAAVFGILGSLLAALAARRIARDGAALLAGLLHAWCGAAVAYGKFGNGDHHAFVSLLAGAMLYGLARALEPGAIGRPRTAAAWGAAIGALAGLALGCWVAATIHVVEVQLVLGLLIVVNARRKLPGLAALGLAFHLAALVVILPAVLSSPWKREAPWMVVNLSWFHPAFLLLGALVFAPMPFLRERVVRAWPWIVAASLALVGSWLAFADNGPARGLREGFEWVSRRDEFMARVGESRPLVGTGTGSALFEALGFGVLLLPIAWLALLRQAWKRVDLRLLPWLVVVPIALAQALKQARFAEALALPMAVVLAWGAARVFERIRGLQRLPQSAVAFATVVLAALASWPCVAKVAARAKIQRDASRYERPSTLAARSACDWMSAQSRRDESESVLATWTWGHTIEWAAERASVATNFGSYVGLEGFRAAPRFFLEEDFERASALLEAHHVRFVLADSDLPNTIQGLIEYGAPERRERYVEQDPQRGLRIKAPWCLTMAGRLMFDGAVNGPLAPGTRPLDRLRLVWISPLVDPRKELRTSLGASPAAWVWEHVPGARIEAHGAPGDELALELTMRFAIVDHVLTWSDRATAGSDGIANLRVPYSTDVANGDGRATSPGRWHFGSRSGTLAIPETAVRSGATLEAR